MGLIVSLLKKIGVDTAIIYVILARGFNVISGLVTIVLISKFMTSEQQGMYFTFSGVIALQVFFELGLGTLLVQFTSHEMGKLKLKNGVLNGDLISKYRLLSLVRLSFKWYSVVAFFILTVVLVAGLHFFSESKVGSGSVNWKSPWIFLVVLTSLSMYVTPIIAIAEGCGLVISANKMRMKQVVVSGLFMWSCIITGNGLFATTAVPFSIIIVGSWWLYREFKYTIKESFQLKHVTYKISWKKEIFPVQWKIALSWGSGYFIFQFLTPLAFRFYGASFAGQLGLSLSVCSLMLQLSMAWVNTKIPSWGGLISRNDYNELNASYNHSFKYSCLFFIFMVFVANSLLFVFRLLGFEFANRVLSMSSFAFLSLCMFGHHIVSCQATYIRTHKIELYTKLSIFTALISFLTIYSVAKSFSYEFIIPAYFIVTWGVFVTWSTNIFVKFRRAKEKNI